MSSPTALASDTPAWICARRTAPCTPDFNRTQADAATIDALYDAIAYLKETERFKAAVFHMRPPATPEPIWVSSLHDRGVGAFGRPSCVQPAREVAQLARADEQARRRNTRRTHGNARPRARAGVRLPAPWRRRRSSSRRCSAACSPAWRFPTRSLRRSRYGEADHPARPPDRGPGAALRRHRQDCGRVPAEGAVDDTDEALRNGLKYLTSLPPRRSRSRARCSDRGRDDGLPEGLRSVQGRAVPRAPSAEEAG